MLNVREEYLLKRRKNRITMNELAKYIGCSQSLISRYETNDCGLSEIKLNRYREYIDKKNSKI